MKKIFILLLVLMMISPVFVEAKEFVTKNTGNNNYKLKLIDDEECEDDPELCEPEPDECEDDPELCEPEPDECEDDPDECLDEKNPETADIPVLVIALVGTIALVIALKNIKTVNA